MSLDNGASIKQDLRGRYRRALSSFIQQNSKHKSEMDQRIVKTAGTLLGENGQGAIYSALSDEPDLGGLPATRPNWEWCFPRMDGENLEFYRARSQAGFIAGPLGVQEPAAVVADRTEIDDCQVVLVPGVAFDREGRRLGRGKGYYDRALARYQGKKIGVGYTVQISDEPLPTEEHDVRMDFIVTEKFILKVKGSAWDRK